MVFAALEEIDPTRAQQKRGEYPALAAGGGEQLVQHLSPSGKVAGLSLGRGSLQALLEAAPGDPAGAVAGAAAMKDKNDRFSALAVLAQAMALAHPRQAGEAAQEAYSLLDKNVAFAEDGGVVDLAQAYVALGESARAAEVAGAALDAAQQHAEDANDQFDLSSPEGVADAVNSMWIPLIGLTRVFNRTATFLPQLALARASDCHCNIVQPLLFSKIAEAMTPAGAKGAY